MPADTTIRCRYPTGKTLYTQIEAPAGTVYNGTTYETFTTADWALYATATPETPSGSGRYVCQFPTGSAAGNYTWTIYLQAGGSPATTDTPIASGSGYWDGTTFGGASTVTGAVASVTGAVGSVAGNVGGNVVGSVASVLAGVPANVIHSGTARGGTLTTIQFDTGASSVDNTYQMNAVYLSGGTGAGQTAVITYGGYVGSTRTATVSTNWATIPDATTTFQILPQGAVVVGSVGGANRTVTQDYLGSGSLTVNDTAGNPVSGATVTAYLASAFSTQGTGAPAVASTTTNASGHWSLSLAPSVYAIVFEFGGQSASVDVTVT